MNKNGNTRDLLKNAPDLHASQNIEQLFETVCSIFRVTREQLLGRLRVARIAFARQVAMTLIYDDGFMTAAEVGSIFNRDHGTVFHAQNKIHQVAQFGTNHERALIAAVFKKIQPNFTAQNQEADKTKN